MISLMPPALALGFCLLTACGTFNETELGDLRSSGLSPQLYTKMEEGMALRPYDVIELTRGQVPESYILWQIVGIGAGWQ